MKAFILSHSHMTSPEAMYQILDKTQAVSTWVTPYRHMVIVLSNLSITELAAVLRTHMPDTWFTLVEAKPDNCDGWLPRQFWEYINDPEKAHSDKIFEKLFASSPPPAPLPSALQPPKPPPTLREMLLGMNKKE